MESLDEELVKDVAAYVGDWIEYRQKTLRIPGVVIAIRYRDQLLLNAAYGLANVEDAVEMTPNHIFRIASHSKTFTATAIMLLAEQHKLKLDDHVCEHLDWLGPTSGTPGA